MSFTDFAYVPMLSVRLAEMTALEETRPDVKDRILPYITLQPWMASKQFANTVAKIDAAFADRSVIVDITDDVYAASTRRPVHDAIDQLRDPSGGYQRWYEFIDSNPSYIPSLQLHEPAEVASQIPRALALGRGIVIRLTEQMLTSAGPIANLLRVFPDQAQVYFILDLERQGRDLLSRGLSIVPAIHAIRAVLPHCIISASASTFPDSFVGLDRQDIFERQFHALMTPTIGENRTIYCDRGSVRAEQLGGGGGPPAPRIDNALATRWRFYREPDEDDRDLAYQLAAGAATGCADWHNLGIWGTEQISQTAAGHGNIGSAGRSTAVRINIHLHIQGGGSVAGPAETTWSD